MDQNTNASSPATPTQPEPQSLQQPTPTQPTSVLALFSLILAFFLPLVPIILAIIALTQIKKKGQKGKGLAVAAILVSVLTSVTVIGMTVTNIQKIQKETDYGTISDPVLAAQQMFNDAETLINSEQPAVNKTLKTPPEIKLTNGNVLVATTDKKHFIAVGSPDKKYVSWSVSPGVTNGDTWQKKKQEVISARGTLIKYLTDNGYTHDDTSSNDTNVNDDTYEYLALNTTEHLITTYANKDQICQIRVVKGSSIDFGCVPKTSFEAAAPEQIKWFDLADAYLKAQPGYSAKDYSKSGTYIVVNPEKDGAIRFQFDDSFYKATTPKRGIAYKSGNTWKIAYLTAAPSGPACEDYATGTPASITKGCKTRAELEKL